MDKKNANLIIFSLLIVIFIDSLGWGIVYPSLEPILLNNITGMFSTTVGMNIRSFWYEAMVGLYMLCMFITSPILGSLSDRYGRKIILTISLLGNALGFLFCVVGVTTNSLSVLVLGRVISGATAGSLPIAQAALMDISLPHEKPKRLSLVALANVTGFALGPVIGALFLNAHIWGKEIPYTLSFWLVITIAVLGTIMISIFFKETFSGQKETKVNALTGFINLYEAISVKVTRRLCLSFFCFMLSWAMFFSLMPLLLYEKFKWSANDIGYFISFTAVFLGLGVVFVMPRLIKMAKLEVIAFGSFIVLFACMAVFPLVTHPVLLWFNIILTISVPIAYISLATLLSGAVSDKEQGKIMGVLGSLIALSWGIGPLLGGYITKFGFTSAYLLISALIISALLIFSKVYRQRSIATNT